MGDRMGSIRQAIIKRSAKRIVVDFFDQLSTDFENNKQVVKSVTDISSKRLRNRVAGYVTRLMKQYRAEKIQVLESLRS